MNNEDIIKKYIKLLRNKYDMGLYPRYVERYCNECDLENFLFADKNNLGYEQIHFYNLGFKEPFHRASLIGFNTKNGPEWFIIDPTYGQFFENKYFKNYMFKYHNNFSISILKHGYIKCSLLNLFYYFDGFLSSKAFSNDNYDEIYRNIESLLLSNNIVNVDINDTKNKLIELLNIRAHILYGNICDIKLIKK